ncbi:MAG: Crp/Fnr family transcriptional regulator [Bacteroidota bacterium]
MPSIGESLHEYLTTHALWDKQLTLKRGEHLHLEGDVDPDIYYVKEGTLRSYVLPEGTNGEHIIRFGYGGDFVTAMDCFLGGRPTMLYTQTLRKTVLRRVRRGVYLKQMETDPALNALWQRTISWMFIGQMEREVDLLTSSPEARYRRVLARSPRLFQEIPAKYIANYLRMTPETLSRIRAKEA